MKSIQLGGVIARERIHPQVNRNRPLSRTKRLEQGILIRQVGWHREQSAPRPKG
ncbi:hypothetical protein N6H13_14560 [Paenibacillus sp. CC-CFT742]|nr:hypothetical protein [Paenibacillus sp. CC-CFT742]WJH31633.1 hypothetical protein N6H13_14560 [Paenibacillus sp. CC-CFT742]